MTCHFDSSMLFPVANASLPCRSFIHGRRGARLREEDFAPTGSGTDLPLKPGLII